MDQNVLEKNYLPISDVKNKGRYSTKLELYCACVNTKGVTNLKFSQNVHFGTTYLSPQTIFKSKAIGLRYLVVHTVYTRRENHLI